MDRRVRKLAAIGVVAGLFSGLFGVGGGSVIVPLLVTWLAFGEREATGTSLAAIIVIAAFAAGVHALYGNVDVGDALLLGVPALFGVLAGTWFQQQIRPEWIGLAFSALLLASAAELVA